jgi:hypothetical protein
LTPYPGPPITEDKLRKELPRGLQHIDIFIMPPYLPGEPAEVFFGERSEKFEVDPETGLTVLQIADLCARGRRR